MEEYLRLKNGYACPLFHLSETTSTNDLAKAYAKERAGDAVFLSDRQTAGRGRIGHTFLSPMGGLYVSFLCHPQGRADEVHLTVAAAVAAMRALADVAGVRCAIKWVNDLFIDGKKVAGILAEGEIENGAYRYAVIGIGINLSDIRAHADIADIATSVEAQTGKIPDRTEILSSILFHLQEALQNRGDTIKTYRENCLVLGRTVEVLDGKSVYEAEALDVTDDGELLLKLPSGERKNLCAGEVHIRANVQK